MSKLTDDRLLPCPFCGGKMQLRYALWPSEGDTDAVIHNVPGGTDCPIEGAFTIGTADDGVSVSERWQRRAAASTSTEGAGVKAAADQLLAALQRYGFPVSDAAVRPLMDGGSLEAQAVHVAAMQLRAKLNPPAPKVTTDEAEERG